MKEITIFEPKFISNFQCIGSQCIEHCCQGWSIHFDKKSYGKYLKSPSIEIKNITAHSVFLSKESRGQWGSVKLNESGECNFLDENKLCKIHAAMGKDALSDVCSTYPRGSYSYNNEINKIISLSCPEATRLLLTLPDAVQFNQRTELKNEFLHAKKVKQHDRLVNLMAIYLVNANEEKVEHGLYAVALMLLFVKKNPQDNESLEHFFENLISNTEEGTVATELEKIGQNNNIKWILLLRLQAYIKTSQALRGQKKLCHYINRLMKIQSEVCEGLNQNMERLSKAWSEIALPFFRERPWMLKNYIAYRIYKSPLTGDTNRSPLSWLYLLTAEWFLIKSLISAVAAEDGEITEQTVIDIIYSFHAVTKHNKKATDAFFVQIDQVKVNDDISLLYLLN